MPAQRTASTTFATVAASQTDTVLVSAAPGARIRVTGIVVNQGDTTASAVTLNSKGSGAGTAISPPLKGGANGILAVEMANLAVTNRGEGLSVSTGAGSATGIIVSYYLVF
jgi:hypothetical protein